jgi:deazaflavin-dependent oxidoreductase (nitroreductase family)
MRGKVRAAFFWTLKHSLNRLTIRIARSGRGPFSLIRHVGRRSGRRYETPVILAEVPGGFVAELTYGPNVDWYQNLVAAGHGTVIHRGKEYSIERMDSLPPQQGLAAYPYPARLMLELSGQTEFRLLGTKPESSVPRGGAGQG